MLHPVFRSQTDEGGASQIVATEQRSWRRRLVIDRELCVFEAVPCRGVAWHEMAGFATLQAKRLAPFVRSGASAAVRNKILMLWFWDQQDLEASMQRAGRDAEALRPIAETLLIEPPVRDGELRLRCASGVDVLTLEGGAITSSRWEAVRSGRAVDGKLLSRPWARDYLGCSLDAVGATGQAMPGMHRILTGLSVAAAIGCGLYAAYWGGALLGAQKRLATLEGDARLTVERIEQLATLRRSEMRDREWVSNYRQLGGSLQLDVFLNALEAPLAAIGVVLKELEIRNDEARLVVISTAGELDLPATLQALARMPGAADIALRENADARQATFSLRMSAYRRINQPVTSKPL